MTRLLASVMLTAVLLVVAACAQSAPVPAPTSAPTPPAAAPTKAAAAPTTAAAQPTAVAAKKVDYPAKGKTLSLVVSYPAGSPTDVIARILAEPLEKELGMPIQVINKGAAGGQEAATDVATAKPDGYTLGALNLTPLVTMYLNPERKAVFNRKSFRPVAVQSSMPTFAAVRADSPYKSLKDLVDAGKANPNKIPVAVTGILGPPHLSMIELQATSGAKFSLVHFDGGPAQTTALLGGHVDVKIGATSEVAALPPEVRSIAVFDQQQDKFAPGVRTAEEQGYKGRYMLSMPILVLPAGVPVDITDILDGAVKRTMQRDDYIKKMDTARSRVQYIGPVEFGALWDSYEATAKELMELAKQK